MSKSDHLFLGLDLGTTNVKALLADASGAVLARGTAPVESYHVGSDGVEQDIEQIHAATLQAISSAVRSCPGAARRTRAVGVSSQAGALQVLDSAGQPAGRVISWLDRRGRPFDDALNAELTRPWFAARIGHDGSALVPGQLLRLRSENLLPPNYRAGFVGDQIVRRLTGRAAHDPTSLALTMLLNPALGRADPDLLHRLGLAESQLPDLLPARGLAGTLTPEAAAATDLPAGLPVSPAVHDQYASALAAGVLAPGDLMLGTGTAWVLLAVFSALPRPFGSDAFCCTHLLPGAFGEILSLRNGGSALAWALKLLNLGKPTGQALDALLASAPAASDGLLFLPFLASPGEGLPPSTAASFQGLRLSHSPAHLLRAVVEGLSCELARYLAALSGAGLAPRRLSLCGPAAGSAVTPQILANLLRLPLSCLTEPDTSALGACILARALLEPDASLADLSASMAPSSRTVAPDSDVPAYQHLLERYLSSLTASRGLPEGTQGTAGAAGIPGETPLPSSSVPSSSPPSLLSPVSCSPLSGEARPLYFVWSYTDVDRRFWLDRLADWLPDKILDAHVHVGKNDFRLSPLTDEMKRQYWVNELAEPIDAAALARCDSLVLPGRQLSYLAFGWPSLEFDIDAQNDYVLGECAARGWRSLVVTDPHWPAQRLARELSRPGVAGAKPYYAMISLNPATRDEHIEKSIFDFLPHHQLEVLNDRRAWVTLHVPKAGRLGHPVNIAEVRELRRRYPNVILVLAHLGRCYTLPHAQEALPPLADDPGLFWDLSAVINPEVIRYALDLLGPSRCLYGTDNPVFYMRGRRQYEGRAYINRTNYPFHFNKQREPASVEASYTLYVYESLLAIRQACEALRLARGQVEAIFHDTAAGLLARANRLP